MLRAIMPRDHEALFNLEVNSLGLEVNSLGPRWRHRGETPSFDRFVQGLWHDVHSQYLVIGDAKSTPIGLVRVRQ